MAASESVRAPIITDIIEYVAFRGERLTLAWEGAEPYVAVRPICERLGLDWKSQWAKLTGPVSWFNRGVITTVGADGKDRQMVCLHAAHVPLWLASISPAKVKPEVRDALIAYQQECALVLFEHVKHRLLGERDAAVMCLARMREDVITRKPLLVKVRDYIAMGWDFERIWRAVKRPRHVVVEAICDLERLGIIDTRPAGFPAAAPLTQFDLFAGA